MQYNILLKPEAELDLDAAISWYESKRKGLGIDLLLHFEDAISFVRSNPTLYAQVLLHFRRILISKFPYAIYYSVDERNKTVDVIAILHTARNPEVINKRFDL